MKILVVDDHVLIREALRGLFKELKPDATVLEAPDAAQTMQLLADQPDVALVLLDLSLPDRDGLRCSPRCASATPASRWSSCRAFPDRANVVRALDHGALGFIPKSAGREVMMSALNLVFSGGVYIPPEILGSASRATGRRREAAAPPQSRRHRRPTWD